MLTDAVKESARNSVLCWLATVDADGQPNVSPKEIFCIAGHDLFLVADIASPNTILNLRAQPRVSVAFVDIFRQHGWKLKGTADLIEPDDSRFAEMGAEILAKAGPDFRVRRLIAIRVASVARVVAPSYRLFPDRTEEEQIRRAHAAYGVRPA
jgi:uncharacterized protein